MAAASAAVMALYSRDVHGGLGQQVDLSILEPIMTAVGPGPTVYDQPGIIQERQGNRSTNNAPRNLYQTIDEHWVAVSTSAKTVAERVLQLVGHPEVIEEPWFTTGRQRAQHADLLDGLVGNWIAKRTREEVLKAFAEVGATVGPVYSPADILDDPQVQALDMITSMEDERLRRIKMHNLLARFSATPGSIRHTGRPLGADTDQILIEELGLDASWV